MNIYASIEEEGHMIAGGVGVMEVGFIGLFDVGVKEKHRQKGLGYAVCMAILSESRKYNTKKAYIEENSANQPAIRLYKKLGCEEFYTYWYRVKKAT